MKKVSLIYTFVVLGLPGGVSFLHRLKLHSYRFIDIEDGIINKKFSEMYGENICVESKEGKGSKFTFTLRKSIKS